VTKDSNRKRSTGKTSNRPAKPYPEFPLYAHPLGYWSKKIKGKIIHFGRWGRIEKGKMKLLPYAASHQAAYDAYKLRMNDAERGKIVEYVVQPEEPNAEGITVKSLCNQFLTAKHRKLNSRNRKISPRTFVEYQQTAKLIADTFGKTRLVETLTAADFDRLWHDLDKKFGPARMRNEINRIKTLFNYGESSIKDFPKVQFGADFTAPEYTPEKGIKLFTPLEIRQALDGGKVQKDGKPIQVPAAPSQLRAMILLGINCGFGNTDVSALRQENLDLKSGWVNFPRPKTKIKRRCPLWPETIAALKAAIAERPKPKDRADSDRVFITPEGHPWVRTKLVGDDADTAKLSRTDAVTRVFGKRLEKLGINGRNNLGFYSLRHTFTTIGLEARDRDAVKALMGHSAHDMLSVYDETGPSDERLQAVTAHVRRWLLGDSVKI
jgi:integrase